MAPVFSANTGFLFKHLPFPERLAAAAQEGYSDVEFHDEAQSEDPGPIADLLAEHGHCPPVANMLENTRTTLTNRLVRFLAWNMPCHAEHHARPMVPFHKLPDLHRDMRAHLKSISPSYTDFTATCARGLKR